MAHVSGPRMCVARVCVGLACEWVSIVRGTGEIRLACDAMAHVRGLALHPSRRARGFVLTWPTPPALEVTQGQI